MSVCLYIRYGCSPYPRPVISSSMNSQASFSDSSRSVSDGLTDMWNVKFLMAPRVLFFMFNSLSLSNSSVRVESSGTFLVARTWPSSISFSSSVSSYSRMPSFPSIFFSLYETAERMLGFGGWIFPIMATGF